jgi:uncharacterized damage-inducible protein DinB
MSTDDARRYPIGRFDWHAATPPESLPAALDELWRVPAAVHRAVDDLDEAQLDTPYRPGAWSVRQVLHHLADSQLHGYIRHKTALVEDNPAIRPYDEDAWARLPDARLPAAAAFALLDAVTTRWRALCDDAPTVEASRTYAHATYGTVTIATHLHFFAWHARHHIAQIAGLRARAGW